MHFISYGSDNSLKCSLFICSFIKATGIEEIRKIKDDPTNKRLVTDVVFNVWAGKRLVDEIMINTSNKNMLAVRKNLLPSLND